MPIKSRPIPLGSRLPWFSITDLDGKLWRADSFSPNAPVLVAFICNHSPYVRHIEQAMAKILNAYLDRGLQIIAISPNDVNSYPVDNLEMTRAQVRRAQFRFAYAVDIDQQAAKAFMASCTPEFFLYDTDRRLVYHGQFDDSRPGNGIPVTGQDIVNAIEAAFMGDLVPSEQDASFGCSVKWTPGREPAYVFGRS